ncbi:MAG: glycoside hydrolase family 127 protein [Verrucomicrobiota bacterium JB022]|nr:glycoside hydrolase family 127 protein [Verrucomicrobiota bacterium JB022]
MYKAFSLLALCSVGSLVSAAGGPLVDTSNSPHTTQYMVDIDDVHWNGGFWGERFEVLQDSMIPYMWDLFQDDYESHAWSNYLLAAGLGNGRDGHFHGPPFNDGDFLKWFESVAQVYAVTKDPELDKLMDEIIEVVGKAQREDGYLHTKVIIPQRQGVAGAHEFEDREHFETYNMGHLITAGIIHYRATGKRTMLDLGIKAADYIEGLADNVPEELALNAICPSHYMGVMELYRVTGEERYLRLGEKMIDIRNLVPEDVGSDHNQDAQPFREQTEAVGHAVRANYLYAGVADVVAENGDDTLMQPLDLIADNVANQKLYITGMTGALYDGASPNGSSQHSQIKLVHQAYGMNYELPNTTAYNETCATIGYNLWNWRMLTLTGDASYADLYERTLYNGVMPGISLEGTHFFYVNALRKSQDFPVDMRWSRERTPNIKSSFCCPPNVLRTIAETHNYFYGLSDDTLWVHLYGANTLDTEWKNGDRIKLRQETDYPWAGAVKLVIEEAPAKETTLKLRIPEWSKAKTNRLLVNGKAVKADLEPGTYYDLEREFQAGDEVLLDIGFEVTLYEAHPHVEDSRNQVAVQYGPLVYCVESNDLPEGVDIDRIAVDPKATSKAKFGEMHIVNTTVKTITIPALQLPDEEWDLQTLYRPVSTAKPKTFNLTLIPYYAWDNRGDTEMTVWIPRR